MKTFKIFIKRKETLLGISVAIAFQLIFVFVWLTGYDGVYERTDQFKVGIVNDDKSFGEEITNELKEIELFKLKTFTDLREGEQELDNRNLSMLIHLPHHISESLLAHESVTIDYYINQSTSSITKQTMEEVAGEINGQINANFQEVIDASIAEKIRSTIAAQSENKEAVEQVASQVVELVQENTHMSPVQENVIKTNGKDGFVYTMVPLLIVLASYIGAMLVSQHLQLSEEKLLSKHRRIPLFVSRQFINILVAVAISFVTVCLLHLFNVEIDDGFFKIWEFQAILMFSFLALSQVFVMWFGNIGMVFNIAFTAIQLVSSGAIVPRELLPSIYEKLGSILPATYGVNGYFSLIYGGGNLTVDMNYLWIIIGALLLIVIAGKSMIYLVKNLIVSRSDS